MSKLFFTSQGLGDMKSQANREAVTAWACLPRIIFMEQNHSDLVAFLDESLINEPNHVVHADAIVTNVRGVGLAVLSADCLPILVESDGVIAAIHAGRLGVGNGIISNTINLMRNYSDSLMRAVIGPAICQRCYEVSAQMYEEFVALHPHAQTTVQSHALDLKAEARYQLLSLGVEVVDTQLCTQCGSDYYSYRGSKTAERIAGVVAL
jgi:YfiH family protein